MYIAIETSTNKVYSFKGAYKLAEYVGISKSTVYKYVTNTISTKEYNGFKLVKSELNPWGNENRGAKIKKINNYR